MAEPAVTDLDAIVERLSRRLDGLMWDCSGHVLAALAAVSDPDIRDALHARDVVAQLDREHQPRRWGDQSDVVVCDCCQRSWPCSVRATLDGAVT